MFLNNYQHPYLNLGCGNKIHEDWINIDFTSTLGNVLKYNLLRSLPLEDGCVKYIYHSHVLEHFSESEGIAFLQECYRLLEDGGILRIVLPDLENIARAYVELINKKEEYSESDFYKYHHWFIIELFDQTVREYPGGAMKESFLVNDPSLKEFINKRIGNIKVNEGLPVSVKKSLSYRIKRLITKILLTEDEYKALNIGLFRQRGEVHKWMYDKYSLTRLLFNIGFNLVELKSPNSSNIPLWESYEFDVKDNIVLNPTSLYLEATK
jgi:predicted SAM-dependent methyltransferase